MLQVSLFAGAHGSCKQTQEIPARTRERYGTALFGIPFIFIGVHHDWDRTFPTSRFCGKICLEHSFTLFILLFMVHRTLTLPPNGGMRARDAPDARRGVRRRMNIRRAAPQRRRRGIAVRAGRGLPY